jgi:transposase
MKAYSMDLRRRVLADSDRGMPTKQVAEKYGVSRTWVRSLKQRRRETGEIAPRVGGGRKPKIDRPRLAALVRAQPDATLMELRERLGVQCSLSAIWMALDKLRLTFKKSRCAPRSKIARTSPRNVRTGGRGKSGSTRGDSSSSTKRGPTRR